MSVGRVWSQVGTLPHFSRLALLALRTSTLGGASYLLYVYQQDFGY